jgi:hypothetical protein
MVAVSSLKILSRSVHDWTALSIEAIGVVTPVVAGASIKQHPLLSFKDGEEKITYIPDSQEDAGRYQGLG